MDGKDQFFIFCFCILIGFAGGILYELFAVLRFLLKCERGKNGIWGILLDILFFLTFAVGCGCASFFLRFPAFRVYMWLGYAVGGIIYIKTLHRILAFLGKVCYNKLIKVASKVKFRKKLSKTGGKKIYDAR